MIVVTGTKGNVGDAVLRQLLDAGESVRAVTRKPDEAKLPDGAEADSPVRHAPTPSYFRSGTAVALLSHPGSAR
jgi:nucleoside-diphosphate-sugar epimerase